MLAPAPPEGAAEDDAAGAGDRRVWTTEEDEAIRTLVTRYGTRSWSVIAEHIISDYNIMGRTGKTVPRALAQPSRRVPPPPRASTLRRARVRFLATRDSRDAARRACRPEHQQGRVDGGGGARYGRGAQGAREQVVRDREAAAGTHGQSRQKSLARRAASRARALSDLSDRAMLASGIRSCVAMCGG